MNIKHRVQVDPHLVGSKFAYLFSDGGILISPAMYDLISHCEPDQLEKLLSRIPCKQLPFPMQASLDFFGACYGR